MVNMKNVLILLVVPVMGLFETDTVWMWRKYISVSVILEHFSASDLGSFGIVETPVDRFSLQGVLYFTRWGDAYPMPHVVL